jgi:hypothetical protein
MLIWSEVDISVEKKNLVIRIQKLLSNELWTLSKLIIPKMSNNQLLISYNLVTDIVPTVHLAPPNLQLLTCALMMLQLLIVFISLH